MSDGAVPQLRLRSLAAFSGSVAHGLLQHPDGRHVVYPLGASVVIKDGASGDVYFLTAHANAVTALALSDDGRLLVSGESAALGVKASIAVWDFAAAVASRGAAGVVHAALAMHRGGIAALAVSPCGALLASLGAPEDNALMVWDLASGKPLATAAAHSQPARALAWHRGSSDKLVTAGAGHVRTWDFSSARRRLDPTDVKIPVMQRVFTAVCVTPDNETAYCGTTSGDVLEIALRSGRFEKASKVRFAQGITVVRLLPDGAGGGGSEAPAGATTTTAAAARRGGAGSARAAPSHAVLVGTGDGAVAILDAATLRAGALSTLVGAVTSVSVPAQEAAGAAAAAGAPTPAILVGTAAGNVYALTPGVAPAAGGGTTPTLAAVLVSSAHAAPVAAVAFPEGSADVFATAAGSEVRLWATAAPRTELLRVAVPNVTVTALALAADGGAIITGWSDGRVRAFLPESGRLAYVIHDAHTDAVTAVAVTRDGGTVLSGGRDGRVRVWDARVGGPPPALRSSWKEHRKEVTGIVVAPSGTEAVSASADGSCLVWNLRRGVRANALFASTLFRGVAYHPDGSQLQTVGSDRRITYWDAADCTALRVMEGGTDELTSVDVERGGAFFATAGLDKLVKLWRYDEGDLLAVGRGHASAITKVAIGPGNRVAVSGSEDGSLFVWDISTTLG